MENATQGARSPRARALSLGKWLVTCALLVIVVRRLPLDELGVRLAHLRAFHVVLLVLLSTFAFALSALRWWRLVRRLGEPVGYFSAFGDASVGILYNLLLPGSVGGDVVRALRMRKRLRTSHHAWSTSLFERIVGLFAMAVTASAAAAIGVDATVALPSWLRYATFGLTVGLAGVLVFASHPFRFLVRLVGKRLPQAARADLSGISSDLEGPLANASIRIETFFWSLLYQAANLVFVIACATVLGAPGHERALVIGIPMIYVLSLAPVTVGGHGLREGLHVVILGALGMPSEVALGLSAAFVASSLLFSGVGALFLLLDRPIDASKVASRR